METRSKIAVIEDEPNICSFIETILGAYGYESRSALTGAGGLELIASFRPDAVLLDLGLPDIDGLEIIRRVRQRDMVPIIVISARTQEKSKVIALDAGADDYLTKPFGSSELMARIRTALRHSRSAPYQNSSIFQAGDLAIDFDRRLVRVRGKEVHLTQIEYKLVSLLAKNAGRVMTYDAIIREIWGPYADSNNQILRVNMAHIRRKLETDPADPRYILTEIGVGYRMREE